MILKKFYLRNQKNLTILLKPVYLKLYQLNSNINFLKENSKFLPLLALMVKPALQPCFTTCLKLLVKKSL